MNDDDAFYTLILGIILGMIICTGILTPSYIYYYHQQAIKHNVAQYNPQTGYFEWKDLTKESIVK
jgi:hypothetical protein